MWKRGGGACAVGRGHPPCGVWPWRHETVRSVSTSLLWMLDLDARWARRGRAGEVDQWVVGVVHVRVLESVKEGLVHQLLAVQKTLYIP